MHIYNLGTNSWTETEASMESFSFFAVGCLYGDHLYVIEGDTTVKMSLSNDDFNFEEIHISNEVKVNYEIAYTCIDNLVYIFGGDSMDKGYSNQLLLVDLSSQELEYVTKSGDMNVPTGRRAHAMEAYDDQLYIFGGVGSNKKR